MKSRGLDSTVTIVGTRFLRPRAALRHATQKPTDSPNRPHRRGKPYIICLDYVENFVESVENMGLPKSVTPSLIRKLNLACDRAYEDAQASANFTDSECHECISVGWCGLCWDAVTRGYGNAKIEGNIRTGGHSDG